ncbi:RraA family protein [Falsihalocynthiibacter sp. SS001]|uniref:RraA family protein n=1 Tax=Falsihalocynthiibacter sp. SS001 TaxID=3349698 RepID=UPI0036D425BE
MATLGERLEQCYSGAVYDVLRGRGITNTVLPKDLRPLDPKTKLAGPVFTVSGSPKHGMDGHETLLRWTEFLSAAPKGHVVISTGQDEDLALMGELSAETLQYRGVKGYVTDGGCRDCDFIVNIGFPVMSRFYTPRDIVGAWTPDSFEVELDFCSVKIAPGDYLIADIDGAVVIPGSIAGEVITEVEEVMQTENLVRKAILDGVSPRDAYLEYGKF